MNRFGSPSATLRVNRAGPVIASALGAVLLCAGCASGMSPGKDEYRELFTRAIQKSFGETKVDNVCLPPTFNAFVIGESQPDTVEVNLDNDVRTPVSPTGRLTQLTALQSVGLVARTDAERTFNGKAQKIAIFRRTDKGQRQVQGSGLPGIAFCYARVELDRVIKWKGPVVLGDYRAAWVYYTTRTVQVADWARAPAILAAFPTVAPVVNGDPSKIRQVALDLSSEGWDVAEYSKLLQLQ